MLVVDNRIAAISDTALTGPDQVDAQVIELGGRTLMPGLINAHVHVSAAAV